MIRGHSFSAPFLLFMICMVMLLSAGNMAAQSVTLPLTSNGIVVRGQGSVGRHDGYGLSLGVGSTFSGVLDVGLLLGASVTPSDDSVISDIGMSYGYAPLKQSPAIPLPAQIYGSYTYRSASSDFLTRNRLLRESRGYSLGLAVVRDTFVSSGVGLRIGGLVEYENYVKTTTVGFDTDGFTGTSEVDYAEYPQTERLSGLGYGGYLGMVVRTPRGRTLLVGAGVLLDQALALDVRPDVQLHIVP